MEILSTNENECCQNSYEVKRIRDKGSRRFYIPCRYLVTLIEFFAFSEINAYRIATSISLVAMVNNSAIDSPKTSNVTIVSCPLNTSESESYSGSENKGEFDWSPALQGYILSAGFLGYFLTPIPGGRLAETYGAKPTVVLGLLISSTGHLLSPLAAWSSVYLLIVIQTLRGIGQGLITSGHSVLAAKWFPRPERGLLNTLTWSGFAVGALTSGVTAGSMCSSSFLGGWPSVYYVQGSLGLLLCLCAQVFLFESPKVHPRISAGEKEFILQNQESDLSRKRPPTPWIKMLTSIKVYAMIFGIFGQFWTITHFLAVQPIFLGTILRFSVKENGFLASIPFVFQAMNGYLGSGISKWLNTHNYVGVDKARKGCNLFG
ncbi:putative inorganic phosphate cotransporter [Nephila pilipes]|uniref:Putative inorganic phosphate cotransporter n=1 Tax=Nephila pilipes TaxID=299642 RepID=A0A8X6QC52_NEPPI|nr:putative inorganic phosphate cotransporter [Nephila pilipes]